MATEINEFEVLLGRLMSPDNDIRNESEVSKLLTVMPTCSC